MINEVKKRPLLGLLGGQLIRQAGIKAAHLHHATWHVAGRITLRDRRTGDCQCFRRCPELFIDYHHALAKYQNPTKLLLAIAKHNQGSESGSIFLLVKIVFS